MAKNYIPEELQALINQYLTDGVLTDKERAVILKKAEGMGLDHDEIDLYLDAEVQKIDQATDAAVRKQKGKSCPYCGGSVPQLADKCPHCGENITAEASEELQEILENLEEALVGLKSGQEINKNKAIVERYARKAEMYYSNNPKIKKLLEQLKTELIEAEKRGKAAVRNATIIEIIKKNRFAVSVATIIIVIALVWGISSQIQGPDTTDDADACIAAAKDALQSGDVDKAASYCRAYKWNSDPIAGVIGLTCEAYVEQGRYDEAIGFASSEYQFDIERNLRAKIASKYISEGEFDKAEYYGNHEYDGYERYYGYLCQCIDYMKSHGDSKQKIKQFIDNKLNAISDRYAYEVRSKEFIDRIYKYADIN